MDVDQVGRPVEAAGKSREYHTFRTIYLLIGGSGMKVGLRLRKRIFDAWGRPELPFQRFLWLDTDRNDIHGQNLGESPEVAARLRFEGANFVDMSMPADAVRAMLNRPENYGWVWQGITRGDLQLMGGDAAAVDGAAQQRALGRLAFGSAFPRFREAMDRHITSLSRPDVGRESREFGIELDEGLEIVVICSVAGGTGAGAFLDAAVALRELYATRNNAKISAYFLLPGVFRAELQKNESTWRNVQANAFAALTELSALARISSEYSSTKRNFQLPGGVNVAEGGGGFPLHEVFLIDSHNEEAQALAGSNADDAYEMICDALYLELEQSSFGTKKRSHRCNVRPHLASFTQYSLAVNDTNFAEVDRPRYVFHLPNAFGSFGVARIPFERDRLRRAAAAWMNQEMLRFLINRRNPQSPDQIRQILKEQHGSIAGLSVDGVITRLLSDATGGTFYESEARPLRERLMKLTVEAEQALSIDGLSPKEAVKLLKSAPVLFDRFCDEATKAVQTTCEQIERMLRAEKSRDLEGEHYRSMRMRREPIRAESEAALDALTYWLLGNPRDYGLQSVEDVLTLLERDYRGVVGRAEPLPVKPSAEPPRYALPPAVVDLMDRHGEAQDLPGWLLLYRAQAVNQMERAAQDHITATAEEARRLLRGHITRVLERAEAWVQQRYRHAAHIVAQSVFAALQAKIGAMETVKSAEGVESQEARGGLREQVDTYRQVVESEIKRFEALESSYSAAQPSGRNAQDLSSRAPLREAAQAVVLQSQGLDEAPMEETAWKSWFKHFDVRPGAVGDDLLKAGVRTLVGRAGQKQRDAQPWIEVQRSLETWAADYFREKGLLSNVDATTLLRNETETFKRALRHIYKSSAPYLQRQHERSVDDALQVGQFAGVPAVNADAIGQWKREDGRPVEVVENHSGGVVLYREAMAVPLHLVVPLGDYELAYNELKAQRPGELIRRHTVADFEDLPTVRPPQSDAEAMRWFELDVLAMEAALLGMLEKRPAADQFSRPTAAFLYLDDHHCQQVVHFLPTLRALGSKLRTTESFRRIVQRRVDERLRRDLCAGHEHAMERAIALIHLANWTMNRVFPSDRQGVMPRYLEHEVARAIAKKWETIWTKQSIGAGYSAADLQSWIGEVATRVTQRALEPLGASPAAVSSTLARTPLLALPSPLEV
jgi:hypothetical protein